MSSLQSKTNQYLVFLEVHGIIFLKTKTEYAPFSYFIKENDFEVSCKLQGTIKHIISIISLKLQNLSLI